jgi:hypothetical protein
MEEDNDAVDGGSRPAIFVHDRRFEQGEKQKRMASKADYFWCTYAHSKYLNTSVLPGLMEKLVAVAGKYRMELAAIDVEWLEAHNGRFMHFMHPRSRNYRQTLRLVKHRQKSRNAIAEEVLKVRHTVIGSCPRFSDTKFSGTYCDNMDKWLGMLWNFLAIIGDYESMLILLIAPPLNCPSVSFASLQGFVLHKFNQPLEPLFYNWDQGGGVFLDRLQRTILSEGNVSNWNSIPTLFAALNYIHQAKAKCGGLPDYSPACVACYNEYYRQSAPQSPSVSQYLPCHEHTDGPCLYCNRGNPYYKSNKLLINLTKYLKAETKRRQYLAKSKDGLLRSDFLDIHSYVKSCHYKLWDLANYTMCLGGVYYAGRFDSYSEVQLEDFSKVNQHFSIRNNRIEHIAQQVFGKSDNIWHTYLLKFHDHCPQLCYLRHLLVFVHCLNFGGRPGRTRLFPDKASLIAMMSSTSPSGDAFTGDASYLEGLAWLKQRVRENLTNPILDVGMHSLRVTFYLWAVLCDTPRATTKRNARHKSEDMVDKYEANAQNVRLALLKHPELFLKQKLGPPQDVLLVTGDANQSRRVNAMNDNTNQVAGLPEVAQLFVEKMLHVSPADSNYRNKEYLLELSYDKAFTGQAPADQNALAVVESMPDEWKHKAAQVYSAYDSLPLACKNKVLEGLIRSQVAQELVATNHPPMYQAHHPPPFNESQVPQAPIITTMSPSDHQPHSSPGVHVPFIPQILKLVEEQPASLTGSIRTYSVSLREHGFSKKSPMQQCNFLFQVVQDVMSLGKSDEPVTKPKLYLMGKKLVNVNDKSSFSRVIDPFFECFATCCNFDLAVFINKHGDYKGSSFKNEKQCCDCKGMLAKELKELKELKK